MATITANSRHRANENYNDILRGPHQVAFDLTNRCNLRCRHCFNSSGENAVMQDELSDEMVRKLALSLADLPLWLLPVGRRASASTRRGAWFHLRRRAQCWSWNGVKWFVANKNETR